MKTLKGCGTALVTPFNEENEVDHKAFKKLVKRQISGKIDFLVPLGTTGEAASLTDDEKVKVLKMVVTEAKKKKVPVIAGAGSNITKQVVKNIKLLEPTDVDGFLIVTPYYNKPTQEGLYNHYKTIAKATKKAIVMYNVPSRTGVNLSAKTCLRLAKIKNIIAVKEASSNYSQISEIIKNAPEDFSVISGNDNETLSLMATGAKGVISVASNIAPKEMSALTKLLLKNDIVKARRLHHKLSELFENCFIETNPIPAKAALYKLGLIKNNLCPPLYKSTKETLATMAKTIRNLRI